MLLNNEMSGGVAVALNPPAMVPENVDVSVTPLMGDVGSVLPNVVSPMVAERAPLADRFDNSVGVSPLAAAGGGGGVSRLLWLSLWLSLQAEVRFDLHSRRAGSGTPWLLTGWADGTEVEFMIGTGCQV